MKANPVNVRVTACRACGGTVLHDLFSLGNQAVSDFLRPGERAAHHCPIELVLCKTCTLVQQRYTAPQDFLSTRHDWYRSGVTETMRAALADVAHSAELMVALQPGDVVLDIGSNDGTLLRSYSTEGVVKVGVEPATNLRVEGSVGVDVFVNDFWSWENYMLAAPGAKSVVTETGGHYSIPKARVITACGMFYDLDDPNKFIKDVATTLHPDGLFIAQLMCLRQTLDKRDVGNLCHEHLEFYSLRSLRLMLARHGLEIFRLESNAVNGGSYRLYVQHAASRPFGPPNPYVAFAERAEEADGLYEWPYYAHWLAMVNWTRQNCLNVVNAALAGGKKVWAYGASTKGNVILQYYGLSGETITAAADRSPEKWGLRTAGTDIPIASEDEFRRAAPEFALVLPYAFKTEFVAREREWLGKGGRFIVPLPELQVIGG